MRPQSLCCTPLWCQRAEIRSSACTYPSWSFLQRPYLGVLPGAAKFKRNFLRILSFAQSVLLRCTANTCRNEILPAVVVACLVNQEGSPNSGEFQCRGRTPHHYKTAHKRKQPERKHGVDEETKRQDRQGDTRIDGSFVIGLPGNIL